MDIAHETYHTCNEVDTLETHKEKQHDALIRK